MIDLTPGQKDVMASDGPLLVTGGPGSGKTTISILKAANLVETMLAPYQKILFLSFARATVGRVIEAIEEAESIDASIRKQIDVDTYHALFWRIISTYGYLLGLPGKIQLLTPQAEAVELSDLRAMHGPDRSLNDVHLALKRAAEAELRQKLAFAKGLVCFDLFAPTVAEIFERSAKIRSWFSSRYPVLIVDEFQDTDPNQWRVVKALRNDCLVLALADGEQRIFDFIGADPARLDHFKETFAPKVIDLEGANHRSSGTDIAAYANGVLSGTFEQPAYNGVEIRTFPAFKNGAYSALIQTVLAARQRLIASEKPDWSIAVLAPTKIMTRTICDVFASKFGKLPPIAHTAAVDISGIMLAAEIVAFGLEPLSLGRDRKFIELLIAFYRGRNGDRPTVGNLKVASSLESGLERYEKALNAGKQPARTSMVAKALSVLHQIDGTARSGNVRLDWVAVRDIFQKGESKQLHLVAEEVRNLRLLTRGSDLRDVLGDIWRSEGSYVGALDAVREAFVQDHFASASKPESGVIVMNMHKSKGKQFDEVIIFEGWPNYDRGGNLVANVNRLARGNSSSADNQQAKQALRVAITRAKSRTTILTPEPDPCVLLAS